MDRIIRLHVERLPEGDFLATSDDVQGLVVEAPTMQALLALIPQVVEMLEETRREHGWGPMETGMPLPESFDLPFVLAA